MKQQAIDRLNKEFKESKGFSQKGKAVSKSVLAALIIFCEYNREFAQAVVQTPADKTIKDCIESTVNGVGGSISDIEVYKRAVQFYFPGADIHFDMRIDLGDGGFSNDGKPENSMRLSLDEFLDF